MYPISFPPPSPTLLTFKRAVRKQWIRFFQKILARWLPSSFSNLALTILMRDTGLGAEHLWKSDPSWDSLESFGFSTTWLTVLQWNCATEMAVFHYSLKLLLWPNSAFDLCAGVSCRPHWESPIYTEGNIDPLFLKCWRTLQDGRSSVSVRFLLIIMMPNLALLTHYSPWSWVNWNLTLIQFNVERLNVSW